MLLLMRQVLGCGKREAFSKGCGKPPLLGLSSRRPRVWEGCGQARRAGAPLGSCGKRAFCVFHGNGAQSIGFPCPSNPAPEGLAAEIRKSTAFGAAYRERKLQRFLLQLTAIDGPPESCMELRRTLHRFTVPLLWTLHRITEEPCTDLRGKHPFSTGRGPQVSRRSPAPPGPRTLHRFTVLWRCHD